MTDWIRLTVPTALVAVLSSPAQAVQYLSIAEAQKLAFPAAANFVETDAGRAWKAQAGGKVLGLFVVDHVIGKHLYIDYAVALTPNGQVHRVDILQYRESYGGDIRSESWLGQFAGKTSGNPLKVGKGA